MKENRFIELLNLYVDQQLSPEEAAELEAEIVRNPSRHRTYQQYCRMQKACAQLFEHERSAAPASATLARALATADRKIEFPAEAQRPLWNMGYSFAALAAAACVAVVLVLQTRPGSPQGLPGPVVAAVVETAPAAAAAEAAPVVEEFTAVLTTQPARSSVRPGLFLTGIGFEDAPALEWTRELTFAPVRKVEGGQFAFDAKKVDETPLMNFRPAPAPAAEEPMAAFQFQK